MLSGPSISPSPGKSNLQVQGLLNSLRGAGVTLSGDQLRHVMKQLGVEPLRVDDDSSSSFSTSVAQGHRGMG